MSAGARDPHADIDALCDGLALALVLMSNADLIQLLEEFESAALKRVAMLDGDDQMSALNAAAQVLARGRTTH